jgi:nucleoside-diphosphate-sugar epimerase
VAGKLLVLGGTVFLGRHVVETALRAGHEVSLFNRGQANPGLFPEAEHLRGDRDGELGALAGRRFDGVVDTSGYVPRVVSQSAELLRDAVARYVFVSSISVYADHSRPFDEQAPLAALADPASEDVSRHYGALKARCERVVESLYGARGTSVRPGLIVGPHDPTDRFTYWVRRLAEGGETLAPGEPGRPVQVIDVRDLAELLVRLALEHPAPTLNASGPARRLSLGEALARIAAAVGGDGRLRWLADSVLLDEGVEPWSELPLWAPGPELAGLFEADIGRALAAGLRLRPLEQTAADTLAWSRAAGEQRPTLSRERERAILERASRAPG